MLEPGTQIGKYLILERIGTGGMADVYEAEDTFLERIVAMKVLPSEFAREQERVMRFDREVRNLAALDHPNIVTVYDVGHDGGCHYYTMTLLRGGDLKQRIQHQGLTPDQALDIFEQVTDALGYAHSKGLIHRDIKPQNIMFDRQGRPILTDLGIAKAIGSSTHMTRTGMIMGTPHYMSPEQGRGIPADYRSDLYSMGAVFYEMLTGNVPYEAEDTLAVVLMHINNPIPELPASLSGFQSFIDRLMAKDPADRFDDASQLLAAIADIHQNETFWDPDHTLPSSQKGSFFWQNSRSTMMNRRPEKRGRTRMLAGALAILILGGGYLIIQYSETLFSKGDDSASLTTDASQQPPSSRSINDNRREPYPAERAVQGEIKRLLSLADKDRQAERWTAPEGSNAYERYKAVLALDSDNKAAREGLVWIVNNFIMLTDSAMAQEKLDQAEDYLAQAATVIPDAEEIVSARKRLEVARKAQAERERILAEKNAAEKEERMAAQKAATAERERIAAEAERERIAAQEAEADRRAAFDIQLASGLKALEDRDKDRAILSFQSALALYPEDALARSGLDKAQAMIVEPDHGDTFVNPVKMTFVYIAAGSFSMGSPPSEPGRDADESLHKVTLTKGYWLQTTEVTQGQWLAVMGENPSRFSSCGPDCPVESVSWGDVQVFLRKINNDADQETYRLPTEAEWEYAARAGSLSRFCFGELTSTLNSFGWYDRNAGGKIHPVAEKRANAWGLYDMYGNVWEWCRDWYGAYPKGDVSDPAGPSSGRSRVLRGGSWFSGAIMCRSAVRHSLAQDNRNFYLGFRLAANRPHDR